MSFLKFLSSASLSLLFFGNIAAECVDLSGTYSCEGRTLTLSKISNEESLHAYTVTEYGAEEPFLPPPFDGSAGIVASTTTCNENQIETKVEASNDGTFTASLAFLNERILAMHFTFVDSGGFKLMNEGMLCDKQ